MNRWWIAIAGTGIQLCLGSVYAWSFFQPLLIKKYGWTETQATWAFSTAIFFLGISAAVGGRLLPKLGPRVLAVTGGLMFGLGYLVAALALQTGNLFGFYLGYGVIGGIGLGLGYVTPVATVSKWFPDKNGLATGMVIMGFGMGALLLSKVLAPVLMAWSGGQVPPVFAGLGVVFLLVVPVLGWLMRNPAQAPVKAAAAPAAAAGGWMGGSFILMWLIFFFNIMGGIAIISFQSPLMKQLVLQRGDITEQAAAAVGATLIGVSSLFNGIGRILWGWVSDHIGRAVTFRILLGTQVLVFASLMAVHNPWLFGCLVCYILLCYGGGFGIMPSFIRDRFGAPAMAVAYGVMLTAWSAAGIAGPQLVSRLKDHYKSSTPDQASLLAFGIVAGVLLAGTLISLAIPNKGAASAVAQPAPQPAALPLEKQGA